MLVTKGFISSGGLKIYYEIEGEGQPLVLLSGGPGFSHAYFQPLHALAPDARLIFYDQRGTGRSDKASPQDYTVEANVEDLEQLRRELELDSCIVLGHSWGGMLAQAYVLKYPAHVSKLILADTFSSIADLTLFLMRIRNAVPEETRAIYDRHEREGLYKDRDRYPDEYDAAVWIAWEPVWLNIPPPQWLQDVLSEGAWDIDRAMRGEESAFRITGTLAQFDVSGRLHEIRVPTLVIVSTCDMPTVAMAQEMARLIPNARLELFEHSRHFPFIEEPDKFLNLIREFIKGKP